TRHCRQLQSSERCVCSRRQGGAGRLRQDGAPLPGRRARDQRPAQRSADGIQSIAKDDNGLIGDVARLRGGWILAVDGPRADMDSLLAPLTDPTSPWRFSAREIIAYADFHAGLNAKAQKEFQDVAN